MTTLYIDESGSMTADYAKHNPCFIISIIKINDSNKIRHLFRKFIRKHYDTLEFLDKRQNSTEKNGKMFINGKFHELKGACLTHDLKKDFIKHICKENCFELFYIVVDNKKIQKEKSFYQNKARAFNYLLKCNFSYLIKKKYIPEKDLFLEIDERNVKTNAKHQLKEYINTALQLDEKIITKDIQVQYFDSATNFKIQIADVFANIYFSHFVTQNFQNEIEELIKNGYIKNIFYFPI